MNSGVVLVVAPEDDLHVQAVQSVLQRNGVNVVQVETRDFPTTINLTLEWSNTVGASLAFPDGMRVHRDDVLALWWRRQGGYRINDTVRGEAEREYARVT